MPPGVIFTVFRCVSPVVYFTHENSPPAVFKDEADFKDGTEYR